MIHLLDQASLYPHCFMGGNLFSPEKGGWSGSDVYPNILVNDADGVSGEYCKTQGKMESVLQQLYNKRQTFTKSDPRNLAYKILINVLYGLTGAPKFVSIYNTTTASDCTALARRTIKFVRQIYTKYGYEAIYTDTDSIFVQDPFNNKEKVLEIAEEISERQRKAFNIYIPSHKLVYEATIKRMYFFKDDKGEFVKKQYIYVKDDDSIKLKGIKLVKGTCSEIANFVYEKHIVPIINEGCPLNLPYEIVKAWMEAAIQEHPEMVVKRYRTKPKEYYKTPDGKDEPNTLNYQITKRYGADEHWLIPNHRIGPGKGIHYAKKEELIQKYGEDWVKVVYISSFIMDLSEFIDWKERKKIKLKEDVCGIDID